jgi:signal transduction histidine kinase
MKFNYSIERVARNRFGMPIILALALIMLVVNEASYQHSRSTLVQGITLSDARQQAARTLQALTDAEVAVRAFMLSAQQADLTNYREAINEMEGVQQDAFKRLEELDPGRTVSVADVRRRIEERTTTLNQWVSMTEQGRRTDAQTLAVSDQGRLRYAELRQEFEFVLERAGAIQKKARVSLYDAMMINRLAIHLLVLVAWIALILFLRQLRENDRRQAEEHQRLATQVALRTTALRNLAGHHVHAREDERGRVARELHDEMGGLLTAMKLDIARLRRVPELPGLALERLTSIEQRLNEGIAVKRRIIEHLRPSSLDQLGLVPALEMLCQEAANRLGISVDTVFSPVELSKDAELTVFRLVQESLTNVQKYAKARHVWVVLEQQDAKVYVSVRDDGQGFDIDNVPAGHHGLLGMRVRVESHSGQLDIHSVPHQGTRIEAVLPSKPASTAAAG